MLLALQLCHSSDFSPQMPPQSYANCAMGPLQVSFSFRDEPPTDLLICVGVCYGIHFLLSGAMLDAIFTNGDSTIVQLQPFRHTHGRHMCILVMVISPCKECTEWLLLPLLQVGGSLLLLHQQSFSHSNNMVGLSRE